MLIYAHRGSSSTQPENTTAAFLQAVADGADGIELDVRATADCVPVVLHDRALERTTSGRGYVDEATLIEVRAVDAGAGQPVPTLAEVCASVAGRLRLDLELKQGEIGGAVLAVLARYPALDWAVSSLDWDALRALRRRDPEAPLWPVAAVADDALYAFAREIKAPTVALWAASLTPDVAHRCQDADLTVMAWTVNDLAEARRLRALGVAALCTDEPAAIRRGLAAVAVQGAGDRPPA